MEQLQVYNAPSQIAGTGLYASVNFVEGFVIGIIQGPFTSIPTDNAIEPQPGLYIETDKPWVYINHSCNPNVELLGHRVLVAARYITEGEELYLDYQTLVHDNWSMTCNCGHNRCRGIIHAPIAVCTPV